MVRGEFHRTPLANTEVEAETIEPTPLVPLSATEHKPENPDLDIRGYLMYASDGQVMGRVEDILLEADRRTADRGSPLYHMEYAVVRYREAAGTQQWLLVPMAVIKETHHQKRRVVVRDPSPQACQQALAFVAPYDLHPEEERAIYAFWEIEPRWARSGRSPIREAERRR